MVSALGIPPSATPSRSLIGARMALFAAFLAAGSLVACSGEPRSLASYIAAICSTPFRSAPAAEAPYLAENVAAMTKMMIDMGIRPRQRARSTRPRALHQSPSVSSRSSRRH